MRVYVSMRKVKEDEEISPPELKNILYYASISLLALVVGGMVISGLYIPPVPTSIQSLALSLPLSLFLFTCVMAISEEEFFRGELFDLLVSAGKTPVAVAILFSALIFAFYHLHVYGSSPNDMLYVVLGGAVLSWAAYKTRRVSTSMIAHVGNNIGGSQFSGPIVLAILVLVLLYIYRDKLKRRQFTW